MREIDTSEPYDEEAVELSAPDFSGISATPAEVNAVIAVIAELDEMSDAELAELEAEGAEAEREEWDELGPWMDDLGDAEFGAFREAARQHGSSELAYLHELKGITEALDGQNQREAARLAQDRRPRSRGTSDEIVLSNSLDRFAAGSYMPNQLDPELARFDADAEELMYSRAALAPAEVRGQMLYELQGGVPPARARREPLPRVGRLSRTLGLVP